MSKITNVGLIRSDTCCFIAVLDDPYGSSGRQRVKILLTEIRPPLTACLCSFCYFWRVLTDALNESSEVTIVADSRGSVVDSSAVGRTESEPH